MMHIVDLREPEYIMDRGSMNAARAFDRRLDSRSILVKVVYVPHRTIDTESGYGYNEIINILRNNFGNVYLFGDGTTSNDIKNKYFGNQPRVISVGTIDDAVKLHWRLRIVGKGTIKEFFMYFGIGLGILIIIGILIKTFVPDLLQFSQEESENLKKIAHFKRFVNRI